MFKRKFAGLSAIKIGAARAIRYASLVFALDAYSSAISVDAEAKISSLKSVLEHSTKAPTIPLKVRAIVVDEQPPWTTEQVEKEVKSQMALVPLGTPVDVVAEHEKNIRNSVKSAHNGRRWSICEETRGRRLVRLDVKEYYSNKPPTADYNKISDDLFETTYINCYEGHQMPYEAARVTPSASEVLLDNSTKPVKYGLRNLFVAQHLEGRVAMNIAVLVGGKLPLTQVEQLIQTHGFENAEILAYFPFDTDKANNLISGSIKNVNLTVRKMAESWEVDLEEVGVNSVRTAFQINYSLPYLISRASITTPVGVRYISERSGITDLGFPVEWKTEETSSDGVVLRRSIQILSATTNVNLESAFPTNWPSGYKVWSRNPNGNITPVSGVTNWSGKQSPFSKDAPRTGGRGFGGWLWVYITVSQIVLIAWVFFRKKKNH